MAPFTADVISLAKMEAVELVAAVVDARRAKRTSKGEYSAARIASTTARRSGLRSRLEVGGGSTGGSWEDGV